MYLIIKFKKYYVMDWSQDTLCIWNVFKQILNLMAPSVSVDMIPNNVTGVICA